MAANAFNTRLAQTNRIPKTYFDAKLSSRNRKITSNKTKHLHVENELKKLKIFDSSYFIGKSYFEEDGIQNNLVFQPMCRYLNEMLVFVIASTFITGNLKDCLMKELILLQRLIIVLLYSWIIMVQKQE